MGFEGLRPESSRPVGHARTAVFYLRDHLRDRRVAGLNINDPQESHVLRALPGRVFSALELLCIMYAGFKRIEPGMDIGVELCEEWGMAERLMGDQWAKS